MNREEKKGKRSEFCLIFFSQPTLIKLKVKRVNAVTKDNFSWSINSNEICCDTDSACKI